ncbi:MAG: hydrogenase iron-sulfur subunit [bacterium]
MSGDAFVKRALFWGAASSAVRVAGVLGKLDIPLTAVTADRAGAGDGAGAAADGAGAAGAPAVTWVAGARVRRVDGHVGRFQVHVEDEAGAGRELEAGWILVEGAAPAARSPHADGDPPAGLSAAHLLQLQGLEELAGAGAAAAAQMPASIALWLDPGEGWPDRTLAARAFRAALALAEREGGPALYVLHRHVPLPRLEGQEIYDRLRNAGVRFFRLGPVPPSFRPAAGDRVELEVPDAATLGLAARLTVDRVVPIGQPVPPAEAAAIARRLGEPLDAEGFLQKDNPHLYPWRAFRAGVYYVGGGRGELDEDELEEEIPGILAEVAAPARSGAPEPPGGVSVDKGRCVSCLTCYRLCPHHALDIGQGPVPVPVHAACFRCGLCAALCPGRAIELAPIPLGGALPPGANALFAREGGSSVLRELPAKEVSGTVVFACYRSGGAALEAAAGAGLGPAGACTVVSVPCACALSEEVLLDALLKGAEKIMVVGCHQDNCLSQKGTAAGKSRLARVAEYLAAAGRDASSCLRFASIASNEAHRLMRLLQSWA